MIFFKKFISQFASNQICSLVLLTTPCSELLSGQCQVFLMPVFSVNTCNRNKQSERTYPETSSGRDFW